MSLVTIVVKDSNGKSLEKKVSGDHCDRLFKLQTAMALPDAKRWKIKKERVKKSAK